MTHIENRYPHLIESEVSDLAAPSAGLAAAARADTFAAVHTDSCGELCVWRTEIDDDALDADYSFDEPDIDDMQRGGK